MYRLSSIIVFLALTTGLWAQSPHGEDFKMDCAACHTSDSWEIASAFWTFDGPIPPAELEGLKLPADSIRFDHGDTAFPLEGGHRATDCRLCHEALVFTNTSTECISCHTDLHNMTVGSDCARCHSVENWLVDNITELHQDEGFPLLGAHAQIDCIDCHISESNLQFHRLGNECINCHMADFLATTQPNHVEAGYSTVCIECHDLNAFDWSAENILHDFFPLVKGHDIDCIDCHTSGVYTSLPTDCISCHQMDFAATVNPDHQQLNFDTDCAACHTLDLDWMPAEFRQHDNDFFPIYSGEHAGEWSECQECHPNPSNYSVFTCTTCHGRSETDGEHDDVGGYIYESGACLACHPTGNEEGGNFNHNNTGFPLRGAHTSVSCSECHSNGYAGTPTDCAACHQMDFEQTTNPDHQQLGFSMDCASCHTESAWDPATFDHDGMYFPIYSGNHANEWNQCSECHTTAGNFALFSCVDCHEHNDPNELADDHNDVPDYRFESTACLECHPNGD